MKLSTIKLHLLFVFIWLVSLLLGASCAGQRDPGPPDGLPVCVADHDVCSRSAECCSNACTTEGFCAAPEDLSGGGACVEDDVLCPDDPADCCSGICDTDGYCGLAGDGSGQCMDEGSDCSTDDDCCAFVCSPDGICDASGAGSSCVEDEGDCGDDTDCCSGFCDPQAFVCTE